MVLLGENNEVLTKPHGVTLEATKNGFVNSHDIEFGPFNKKCKIVAYRIRNGKKNWRTGSMGSVIDTSPGDTITIPAGDYHLSFEA